MNKSELIDVVTEEVQWPRKQVELIVDTIFSNMTRAMTQNKRIEIRGFGSFSIKQYKGYTGRNPRTGDPVVVNEKRLPFFKVGKELKSRVNPK